VLDLRWILFLLGIVVFLLIYFFSIKPMSYENKFSFFKRIKFNYNDKLVEKENNYKNQENFNDIDKANDIGIKNASSSLDIDQQKVITLRLIGKNQLDSLSVFSCLQENDFNYGRFGIFNYYENNSDNPIISIANLTEPGTFDIENKENLVIGGLTIFMQIISNSDGVSRFDLMVGLAKNIAAELNVEILDENGSSWSVQRERYIREEIIAFQHGVNK
jgi:cell division protein ZipA|tara:strand:- start:866 stop:1519 length:654 start_codon:yes stop_codon:yes gene_type:complete